MQEIKLMVIESNEIIRNGIKHLLSDAGNITVTVEASSPDEALELVGKSDVDAILLSMSVPDPHFSLVGDIRLELPEARVMVMSNESEQERIRSAVASGALGYVPSDITKDELIEAINTVARGEVYFSRKIAHLITQDFISKVKQPNNPDSPNNGAVITHREMEILKLIAEGYSSQEIAIKLYISSRTVENHRANIMQKCRVKNAAHLVNWGYQNRILKVK